MTGATRGAAGDGTLLVNGTRRSSSAPNVGALLKELGHDPGRPGLAVAVNGEVVPRARWNSAALADGDTIEIVGAVQGG